MNKVDLKVKVESLKKMVQDSTEQSDNYKKQLETVEKQLADINKPAITPAMMEQIEGAIETAVEDFDFSDDDNFEKEFEIDYDSRIRLSNLDFTNSHDLIAEIAEKVLDLFRETEEEETTTTDNS